MKKFILLILFASGLTFAQTDCETIGEIHKPHQKIEKCGNEFTYTYQNANSEGAKSFTFKGAENFHFVRNEFNNLFKAMPKSTYDFYTPDGTLHMNFKKVNGVKSYAFSHTDKEGVSGKSDYITEAQFHELFKWHSRDKYK